jgi:hypothetical protein
MYATTSIANAVVSGSFGPLPEPLSTYATRIASSTDPIVVPIVLVGIVLVDLVIRIGAIRTFVTGTTDRLDPVHFKRNIGWTVGSLVVGFMIYAVAVGLGSIFLVVPGIYLAVSLYFFEFHIAVEGENFMTAMEKSWSLTDGHRWDLFFLGLVLAIVHGLGGLVSLGVESHLPGIHASVLSAVITASVGMFALATGADAFRQLRGTATNE